MKGLSRIRFFFIGEIPTYNLSEQQCNHILFFRDRSLFIAWGQRILGGITSFMGEQKEGSVVTENPKGGIAENFKRIQRGDLSNLLVR